MRNGALLLRGGTVIDGTGAARYVADVRVEDDRIAAIGASLPVADATVIDATGLVVAPGFIDVHTHDDQIVLAAPSMLPKISQGVATVVVGNCGISLAPLVRGHVPPPLNLLGGTDNQAMTVMMYLLNKAPYGNNLYGFASAVAYVVCTIIVVVSLLNMRLFDRDETASAPARRKK